MGTSATSPASPSDEIVALKLALAERDTTVTSQAALIAILEEKPRLATHQQFAPSSEKLASLGHPDLFNEAEALGTKPETEVGLADAKVDDVLAGGRKRCGARQHFERSFGSKPVQALGEWQYDWRPVR